MQFEARWVVLFVGLTAATIVGGTGCVRLTEVADGSVLGGTWVGQVALASRTVTNLPGTWGKPIDSSAEAPFTVTFDSSGQPFGVNWSAIGGAQAIPLAWLAKPGDSLEIAFQGPDSPTDGVVTYKITVTVKDVSRDDAGYGIALELVQRSSVTGGSIGSATYTAHSTLQPDGTLAWDSTVVQNFQNGSFVMTVTTTATGSLVRQ